MKSLGPGGWRYDSSSPLKKCFATRERRICCDGKAEDAADIREYCGILQRSQRGEDGVRSRFDFFNGLLESPHFLRLGGAFSSKLTHFSLHNSV